MFGALACGISLRSCINDEKTTYLVSLYEVSITKAGVLLDVAS